jgi:hypothetical protein
MLQQALPLLLIIAAAIIIAVISWNVHQARVAGWAEFASRHDMHADGLTVEGSYEGYPLRLETQKRGSGKNRYTVTVLHLSTHGTLPPDFSLEREGFGDKLLKLFGGGDAEIGDAEFDRLFDVKNLSPETTRLLRNKAVQQHLYELVHNYRTFHIREGWIQAEQRGVLSTADALETFTGPALMLVHSLDEAFRRSTEWTAG